MKLLEEAKISLEVLILLFIGLIMLILGIVLVPIALGVLPYYEDGVFGLLLIIGSLQMQTSGKTQFGFMKRSWPAIIIGFIIAVIGFVTCFVPGIFGDIPKILIAIFLGIGGIVQLLGMFLSKNNYPYWKTLGGGIYTNLTISCATVYILNILIGILIAVQIPRPGFFPTELWAFIFVIFGFSLFYLAITLQKVYTIHPESDLSTVTPGISLDTVIGMQFGLFMFVVGCLLVPVSLRLLPFAPNAQMGTMLVLMGVQTLIIGSIMSFGFKRNWIILFVGMVFVAMGAFAVIVPDVLNSVLNLFIALFNIIGGVCLLYNIIMITKGSENPAAKPAGKVVQQMILMKALMFLTVILMILFGLSMLIQNLIPGIIIGIILACFGLSQFVLLYIQSLIAKNLTL